MKLSFGSCFEIDARFGGVFLSAPILGSIWLEVEQAPSRPYFALRRAAGSLELWAGRLHVVWGQAESRERLPARSLQE
jgi:hypothetical protein